MVPSPHPSACYALAAADRRKDAQVNQFHDHGRVRQHAAMTGSRRQAAAAVAPARWRPSGWGGHAAAAAPGHGDDRQRAMGLAVALAGAVFPARRAARSRAAAILRSE